MVLWACHNEVWIDEVKGWSVMMAMLDMPSVIGHRGAAGLAPENTLAAIDRAKQCGAGWIEIDVKLTADDVPILMHDGKLRRTTNGRGQVANTSWDDLQKLDAGSWFSTAFQGERVPSLSEALQRCQHHGLGVNIELKPCKGREVMTTRLALDVLEACWSTDRSSILISSFDGTCLETAKNYAPNWPRGYLCTYFPKSWRYHLERYACSTLHISNRWVRQRHIDTLKAEEVPLLVYTVNDMMRCKTLLHAGVSAIFSDQPGRLIDGLSAPAAA